MNTLMGPSLTTVRSYEERDRRSSWFKSSMNDDVDADHRLRVVSHLPPSNILEMYIFTCLAFNSIIFHLGWFW
jgi:hypothetical protein